MNTILRSSLVALSILLLSGCATCLTQQELKVADCGSFPDNHQEQIKQHFETVLFDPYSAKYKFSEPTKGYTRKAPLSGGDPDIFGYVVKVSVNAKNRMGGYVGAKKYNFLIRDEALYIIYPNPTYFSEPWYQ